jgi:hypothetical protein
LHVEINGSLICSKALAEALASRPCRQTAFEVPAQIPSPEEIYACQFNKSVGLVLCHDANVREHQRRPERGVAGKFPHKILLTARREKFPVVQIERESIDLTLGPPRVIALAAPLFSGVSA